MKGVIGKTKNISIRVLTVLLAGILAIACEQPFKAGLGTVVDVERPGVRLESPNGGSFIRGKTELRGESWDDIKVDAVQFRITFHSGLTADIPAEELLSWRNVEYMDVPKRNGSRVTRGWRHQYLDTRIFHDGEIRIRFRVSDGVVRNGAEWEETDDIAFFIRNTPPAITMNLPVVDSGTADGGLGSAHLNFNFATDIVNLRRSVDGNASMVVGMIGDDRGINTYLDEANGRFPPRFRLWEVAENPGLHAPLAGIPVHAPGSPPTLEQLGWRNFGSDGGMLIPIGATLMQFLYVFDDERAHGRYFAFQLSAQSESVGGHYDTFVFPEHEWNPAEWEAFSDEQRIENSFVAFLVVPPQLPPELEFVRLQNISDGNAWDETLGDYRDIPGLGDDVAHPYIIDPTFNAKSGAFTLRLRASRSGGISHAMAFWEGGGRRGRFIWDPVHDDQLVPASLPFSRWGSEDPNLPNVRNFVFSYRGDEAHDRVPDSDDYNVDMRGRYRIQEFIGTDLQWSDLFSAIDTPAGWAAFYGGEEELWRDDTWNANRTEGVFTIRVYARTVAGTSNTVPLLTFLTLDREPPALELTQIDGSAGEVNMDGRTVHVVNEVIMPRFFASDARGSDSGHRVSGGYFARPGGADAEEVMFLVIHERDRAAMEGLGSDFWPVAGGEPVFPQDITVYRHGPVHDGTVRIRTSCIGCKGEHPMHDPLDDGDYWLYVFARDRAFNVGGSSFPLRVDAESDRPVFDFSIGLVSQFVSNPNVEADDPDGALYGTGFNYRGTVRNILRPTSNIRFRVRDDDGLNLGVQGGAKSSMRISFTGSFIDTDGVIRPLTERDENYFVELSDADVKGIFRPRDTEGSPALREREGTIPQSLLLDLLRHPDNIGWSGVMFSNGTGAGYNSLPDGMYRMAIEVYDDPSFKIADPAGTSVDSTGASVEFWVAVDNVPPDVDLVGLEPVNESRVPRGGAFYIGSRPGSDGGWVGTVRDDNGPVTVSGFRVIGFDVVPMDIPKERDILANPPPGEGDWITLRRIHENQDTWEYVLAARVDLSMFFPGIHAGNFEFEIILIDRFGNSRTIRRQHQMDYVPPTLTLTRPIETFSRPSVAETYGITVDNANRLANRVISFSAHAWDNFTLEGIRWWLLPSGISASGTVLTPGGLYSTDLANGFDQVHDFDSYPARNPGGPETGALDVESGRAFGFEATVDGREITGAFGWIQAPGGGIHIDTYSLGLLDGEYRLHIIAKDAHGNDSMADTSGAGGHRSMDRVFLLQEEDRPYFSGIRPDAGEVRGEHGFWITGVIMDDDGFGMGTLPDPGSVRIWVSRQPPPPEFDSGILDNNPAWQGRDVPNQFLTLSGRDIVLNINLLAPALFPDLLGGPDGTIHYVIRAQDSLENKLREPGDGQERVWHYRGFSFVRDTQPPEITLASPLPGDILNADFDLVGHIADVNLSRTESGGETYVYWMLNDGPSGRFVLSEDEVTGTGGEAGGLERVDFRIAASVLFSDISDFDDFGEGHYKLELTVVDRIGMASVATLDFTIDRSPPSVAVNFPGTAVEMSRAEFDWWNAAPADPADRWKWNEDRRAWISGQEHELPVVVYDGGAVATVLTGSVSDTFSDIFTEGVTFRFNDGLPIGYNPGMWEGEGRNWRWELPLTVTGRSDGAPLPDGVHTITIDNVSDKTGNPSPVASIFVFRIDSTAPNLPPVAQDDGYRVLGDWKSDEPNVFTIGGTASDANLMDLRLRFREQGPGGINPARTVHLVRDSDGDDINITWNWDTELAELTWRYDFSRDMLTSLGFFPRISYEIEIVALDWSGGESEPVIWVFTIDNMKPVIEFASGLNVVTGGTTANFSPGELVEGHGAFNRFIGQNLTIQGTVRDDHSDISKVESRMEWWDGEGWTPAPDRSGWIQVTGTFLSGSPRNRIWRTENLNVLNNGLYRLQVRAMDSSWTGERDVVSGKPVLYGNPDESDWLYFYYDRGTPDLDFDGLPPQIMSSLYGISIGPNADDWRPGFLPFRVSASDDIGIRHIRAMIDGEPGSLVELPVFDLGIHGTDPSGDTLIVGAGGTYLGRWESGNSFTIFVPSNGVRETRHTVVITAEGLSGRTSELRRSIDIDNTAPGGQFATPDQSGLPVDGFEFSVAHLGSAAAELVGETFDRINGNGTVESGVVRMDFRLGLIDGDLPTAETLARRYTGGAASDDTSRNNKLFDEDPAWFLWGEALPGGALSQPGNMPDGFSRPAGSNLFSWQINVAHGRLLEKAYNPGMSRTVTVAGVDLLEMPVWFRVVDGAGNAGYFHRVIRINPEADRPVNVILTPGPSGDNDSPRGGNIFFNGVAQIGNPEVSVDSVLYRVWIDDGVNPRFLTQSVLSSASLAQDVDIAVINRYASLSGGVWFAAVVDRGFVAPWNFSLNTMGEITALILEDSVRVRVDVVAINSLTGEDRQVSFGELGDGGGPGNPLPNSRTFDLTASAPRILNARVDRGGTFIAASTADPVLNNPHRGTFTISATLDAGSNDQAIGEIRIVRPHETAGTHGNIVVWDLNGTRPWAGVTTASNDGGKTVTLTYTLNSLLDMAPFGTDPDWVRDGAWKDTGGDYHVEIRVSDSSSPPAVTTLTLPIVIDNFAPVADPELHTNPMQVGTGVFQGRVLDGTHGAATIDRVYVWFEKRENGGMVVIDDVFNWASIGNGNLDTHVWVDRAATFARDTPGFDPSMGFGFVDDAAKGTRQAFSLPPWAMEISQRTWGTMAGREYGQLWVNSDEDRIVRWQFTLNTRERLPDGPVLLRYVAVDTAGNASLYEQGIVIRNNTPEITWVDLHTSFSGEPPTIVAGTNLDSGGSVRLSLSQTAEEKRRGYIEARYDGTRFVAKNRWLGFTLGTFGGNPPLNYRVQHVTRNRLELTTENLLTMIHVRNNPGETSANLYTVAGFDAGASIPAEIWSRMGGDGIPGIGDHFVFLPSRMAELAPEGVEVVDLPGVFVWQYTVRKDVSADNPAAVSGTAGLRFGESDFAGGDNAEQNAIPRFVLDNTLTGNVPNSPDWKDRPFFLIRVWDSTIPAGHDGRIGYPPRDWNVNDQLHAALVVDMDVLPVDDVRPVARLHALNTGFITSVASGNNLTETSRNTTVRNALDPLTTSVAIVNNNSNRGGLFNVGNIRQQARSGYIDPGFEGTDLVSGRIILRGRAEDNGRIQHIQLQIGSDMFTILEWNPAGNLGASPPVPFMRVPMPSASTPEWVNENTVRFIETMHPRDGHVVEWAFLWDTETLPETGRALGSPASGVTVNVHVRDGSGHTATQDSVPVGNTVDIVPYVTGFRRQSHYANIRSMQGWYSFYQGEREIEALGWNLNGNIATTNGMTLNAPATPGFGVPESRNVQGDRSSPISGYHIGGMRTIAFSVPATTVTPTGGDPMGGGAQSGRINFTVSPVVSGNGAVPIHNHRSDPSRSWNGENLPAGDRQSVLWTNRPYAHIWRTGPTDETSASTEGNHIPRTFMGPFDNTAGLEHPGMALEYAGAGASPGRLHGAWGVFGTAMIHYGTNQRGSVTGTDAFDSTRLSTGTDVDPFVMPDISIHNGTVTGTNNSPNIAFIHMHDNTSSVRMRVNVTNRISSVGTGAAEFPVLTATGGGPRRWQNVRVVKAVANSSGTHPGRLHTSVYDALNRSLVFVTRGPGGGTNTSGNEVRVTIDGPGTTILGAGLTNSGDAGLFSAIGYDEYGPIVAYYDFTNDTIRVAWGWVANPGNGTITAPVWTRSEILRGNGNGDLFMGSGRYASMAVDNTGDIHLAFFNTRLGALVYAHAPARTAATSTPVFSARIVDTMDGVGTWTDISVDHDGNPWIVYGYQGRQGNYDGIRMAYRSRNPVSNSGNGIEFATPLFLGVSGSTVVASQSPTPGAMDLTGWEAVQMPAPFRASYDRLNIEAWPPSNRADANAGALDMAAEHRVGGVGEGRPWSAAIGYASGGNDRRFRVGYFFKPTAFP